MNYSDFLSSEKMSRTQEVHPYGYRLPDDVFYIIEERVLFNYSKGNFRRIQLRTTMANLLCYLLNNAHKGIITDDELMIKVWEDYDLKASSHRLWQVFRDLREKLEEVGLLTDIFFRVERRGYMVELGKIHPLYNIVTKPALHSAVS